MVEPQWVVMNQKPDYSRFIRSGFTQALLMQNLQSIFCQYALAVISYKPE